MILKRNLGIRALIIVFIYLCYPFGVSTEELPHHHKLLKEIHDEVVDFGTNVNKSDYSDIEMEELFTDILKGIRNKKEILKLIKQKQ